MEAAAECLEACRALGVPLVINDRVDVCLAVGADGVHVGQDDIPAAMVRAMIGPDRILGVSAQDAAEVARAAEAGADYVGCGAVYPTATKGDAHSMGLGGLAEICAGTDLPVVAIGGIKPGNGSIGACLRAGAVGVAVVSGIFDTDPAEACRGITREVAESLGLAGGEGQ